MDINTYLDYNTPYLVKRGHNGTVVFDELQPRHGTSVEAQPLTETINGIDFKNVLNHHITPDMESAFFNLTAVASKIHAMNLTRVGTYELNNFTYHTQGTYDNYQRHYAKHPSQPIELDWNGGAHFKPNHLIQLLASQAGLALDKIIDMSSAEDVAQFRQLLGDGVYDWGEVYCPNYQAAADVEQEYLFARLAELDKNGDMLLISPYFLREFDTPVLQYGKDLNYDENPNGEIILTHADYWKHKSYLSNDVIYIYKHGKTVHMESESESMCEKWCADEEWNYWELNEEGANELIEKLTPDLCRVTIPYSALAKYGDYKIAAIFATFKRAEVLFNALNYIEQNATDDKCGGRLFEIVLDRATGNSVGAWPKANDDGSVDRAIAIVEDLVTRNIARYVPSRDIDGGFLRVTDENFEVRFEFDFYNGM